MWGQTRPRFPFSPARQVDGLASELRRLPRPRHDRGRASSRFFRDRNRHVAMLAFADHDLEGNASRCGTCRNPLGYGPCRSNLLTACLHNDIPRDNSLLLGGTTRSHRSNDRASGRLFCLRSSAVNVRIFNPTRGASCAPTETANTSTTTARKPAIVRTNNVLDFAFRSRITILHAAGPAAPFGPGSLSGSNCLAARAFEPASKSASPADKCALPPISGVRVHVVASDTTLY
jgi:hypothetical protein